MSILKSAVVKGLWGEKTVSVNLDPKVNFLIGVNGSGKTTLLNLIASALSSDYEGLSRNSFTEIECVLSSSKGETRISVARSSDELERVDYSYSVSVSGKAPTLFLLVNPSPRFLSAPSVRRARHNNSSVVLDAGASPLNENVNVKWLTVHRAPARIRGEEGRISDSSIDRRMTSLSDQLVRYFSKLATQRDRETNRFLRQMLTALVYSASEFNPFTTSAKLDLPAVQASIETLMDTFLSSGVDKIKSRLKEHFDLAANATTDKDNFKLDELIALAAVMPMQKVAQEWSASQTKQEGIAKPRTEFLEVINNMYKNKVLSLNQKNELEVDLPSGKHLPLSELSSGEKQLFILFAEALLQEKSEYIYIADEPELSLHVTWQEQLTRNLLKVNPNAQVIFATHSPDIVSQFGSHTIDMETLFV